MTFVAPLCRTRITRGFTRDSQMEKALFACDELAGFITATALIKPNKSLAEVDAKSVRKRMKDKAFARSVSREDIINGAAGLGVDLDEHITFCIEAMNKVSRQSWDWEGSHEAIRRGAAISSSSGGTQSLS